MLLLKILLSVLFLLSSAATITVAHNITRILAKHRDFSTFNQFQTVTNLAKNILSLHVLLNYFSVKKLHHLTDSTTLAVTLFQAPGLSGCVNIWNLKGGKVGFETEDNGGNFYAYFVKALKEKPYFISVLQISNVLYSQAAEAPPLAGTGDVELYFIRIMSTHGFKHFADALLDNARAVKTYQENIEGGLTAFCPLSDAFMSFLPKYRTLNEAYKTSFPEFFAVPIYQSVPMLKSNNGEPMSTLALMEQEGLISR